MKRPRSTSFAAPSPGEGRPPEPERPAEPAPALWRETAPIVAAVLAILDATEIAPKAGPAQKAYRSAMRRQGEAAAAIGGAEATEAVLRQVAEADPARAESRIATLRQSWADLMERGR